MSNSKIDEMSYRTPKPTKWNTVSNDLLSQRKWSYDLQKPKKMEYRIPKPTTWNNDRPPKPTNGITTSKTDEMEYNDLQNWTPKKRQNGKMISKNRRNGNRKIQIVPITITAFAVRTPRPINSPIEGRQRPHEAAQHSRARRPFRDLAPASRGREGITRPRHPGQVSMAGHHLRQKKKK